MDDVVKRAIEVLRRVAQNDYMIDGRYLVDGVEMMELADELEKLHNGSARAFYDWHINQTQHDEHPCPHKDHEQFAWEAALAWARGQR